ncbi:ClpP/crotonase [Clavulina sp. PMI_390]|nr:ClpP/crotonase [Clavulina sp. PMI_390]
MTANVEVVFAPPICTVTFNEPETLNAFTNPAYDIFADALEEAERRPDIFVTVWQATGRFFNSGANVGKRSPDEVQRASKSQRRKEAAKIVTITDLARQLYLHSKLLVAVLNGPAVGIGAAYLGTFDLVYSAPNNWIAVPFHSIGIAAEVNSTTTFIDKLGLGKANEVLYFGRKIHIDDLLQTGFVNKVFPPSPQVLASLSLPASITTTLPPPKLTPAQHLAISRDLHAQVHAYLLDSLETLDLDALLLTKKLLKTTLHERNNPDAVSARESAANVSRNVTGVVAKRFQEVLQGKRKHKL